MIPMFGSLLLPISRTVLFNPRSSFCARCSNSQMGSEITSLIPNRKHSKIRLIDVSGYKIDLLEIHAKDPKLHVLFIPGNPGVIAFYTDFLESLYELLGGTASVTGIQLVLIGSFCGAFGEAIGHISHTEKNWESGRLFSLQEQIEHKMSFIEQELQDALPIILVGHSIGSYISLEIFRRYQEKVIYCICLYPFLAVNTVSSKQSTIRRIAASRTLSATLSSIGAFLGKLPAPISRFLAKKILGKSCSSSTVEVLCTYLLQYHTVRNMLFLAMTEFEKLREEPDWDLIRAKKSQITFLFGIDDHWGPLHLYEEIYNQIPDANLVIEREGHTHAFSCTEAGSIWVAQHVTALIKNNLPKCS